MLMGAHQVPEGNILCGSRAKLPAPGGGWLYSTVIKGSIVHGGIVAQMRFLFMILITPNAEEALGVVGFR